MACSYYLRLCKLVFLVVAYNCSVVLAESTVTSGSAVYMPHQERALQHPPPVRTQNYSSYDLDQANKLIATAVKQQSLYNAFRVANPRRNSYTTRPSSGSHKVRRGGEPAPPALTEDLFAAAALVAEHTAAKQLANGTLHKPYNEFEGLPKSLTPPFKVSKRSAGPYWAAELDHGVPPMGYNPSYPVSIQC